MSFILFSFSKMAQNLQFYVFPLSNLINFIVSGLFPPAIMVDKREVTDMFH